MVLRGRGAVVFVSSDAAVEGYPTWGAYGASKAGLDQLARVWAAELDADPASLARPEDVAARIADLLRELPPTVRMKVAS
jgi:short-subunit dehydrogenase